MYYYHRIQYAIDYIEENLKQEINIQTIAELTFYSVTHFYRVFQALVGDSVKSYIQKRRLTHAAIDVLNTNRRLIDIAFDYQYNSQEVFTRAFQSTFGITPGKYRLEKSKLVLHKKINIFPQKTENIYLNNSEPTIILNKSFDFIGMTAIVQPGSDAIQNLWNLFHSKKSEIGGVLNPDLVYGVCEYMPNITDESEFTYFCGVEAQQLIDIPRGMIKKTIPISQYAVFSHKGSIAELKSTYDFIYGYWLANSCYELAELDTIEIYKLNNPNSALDIYIPLRK